MGLLAGIGLWTEAMRRSTVNSRAIIEAMAEGLRGPLAFCFRAGLVLKSGGGGCAALSLMIAALTWCMGRAACGRRSTAGTRDKKTIRRSDSLNPDPYNLRAEELAIEDCSIGVEIRRTWSEQEMVRSFNGGHIPGTPDGMFESWDGALTCVQVVRVPLLRELDAEARYETLAQTIITKVVKSQAWLRATLVTPSDFVIFCWLPFAVSDAVSQRAHALMDEVRTLDPRFSLRLRVPSKAKDLFPARFASNHDLQVQRLRGHSWSEVATYNGSDESSDDDDEFVWDIWAEDEQADWAVEGCVSSASLATVDGVEESSDEGEGEGVDSISDSLLSMQHFPWDVG